MNHNSKNITLLFLDILSLVLAGFITFIIRYNTDFSSTFFQNHSVAFLSLLSVWLLVFYVEGLYSIRNQSLSKMVGSLIRVTVINGVISIIYFYIFTNSNITPKTNIAIFSILSFLILLGVRYCFIKLLTSNAFIANVVLIGPQKLCSEVGHNAKNNPLFGINIINVISDKNTCHKKILKLDFSSINTLAIANNYLNLPYVVESLYEVFNHNVKIVDLIEYMEVLSGEVSVENLEKSWVLQNFAKQSNKLYFLLKNIFDKLVAILIGLITVPLMLMTTLIVLVFNGRPIFFTQERTGYLNKAFTLVKFRTMVVDAEKDGAIWAKPGDSRVTRIGKFLRKSRIDELPQLWNVLAGDMSLVGPRPERPVIIKKLEKNIPFYNERHLMKPGITGWAQVNFGYGFSEEDAVKKLKYDLYYAKHKSFLFDLKIILKTVKTVISGVGH